MFGFRFAKVEPMNYVLQFKRGKVVREGAGLSFFYFSPTSSLMLIPIGSREIPFIFEEVTKDFQEVTVQGQLTYRVANASKLAQLMNFTLTPNGKGYASEDPKKLPLRLINHLQVLTRASLKSLQLRKALGESDTLITSLREQLQSSEAIASLGIEILDLSILAIKPTPETSRALEAEAREQILREADEAIYARRNAAVEQERNIKENELATDIAIEQKNKELISLAVANAREEADAKAYAIAVVMKAISKTDPKTLQALTNVGLDPSQLVALAFRELAESADKIGQLNVSPDLLRELLQQNNLE
jgi:regulator of protease activity HflC (stomatin/prohibitin superfamily)